METTLNTFLNNLKKDDISNYQDYNKQSKQNKPKNYNIQQKGLNINRKNNYYKPDFNLVDSYQVLLNDNNINNIHRINNLSDNINVGDDDMQYARKNQYQKYQIIINI